MPRTLLLLLVFSASTLLAPAQAGNPHPPVQTLKATARLVVVDVVVTDKNQNPVHQLKQSDFTLLEANAPQTIRHFEEHIDPELNAAPAEPMPAMAPGVFTNFSPAPPASSLNVLLLDTLNTPLKDQAFVRDQLRQHRN